jgi:hypothetical protein
MDEKRLREGDVEPRAWLASDGHSSEIVPRGDADVVRDDLSRRRQLHRALTQREEGERWPCG